jgi:hypothetical protein
MFVWLHLLNGAREDRAAISRITELPPRNFVMTLITPAPRRHPGV